MKCMNQEKNIEVELHRIRKSYEFKTMLTYTPSGGGRGWIIQIKEKK